ncbi:uracil-DNA glycosylase [Stigmatella aurantiaca]|uniref:Type-4 uracil-DNA glycosylase n=1 Tax=Stigmatella aurantiaca (strain DW4/3-1) TaxID=378806 RepID=Q08SM3_STIAD|nr:uracil-DNA glycosylase [Stigmatella aurantiaca]ADO72532.1 Phage SPO1 DNA polymerase domain protein [Stigmatella aurantiaca DW4/3-1]EAU63492.1 phage SPO1 DNA polymerase domain protein [Stigmatella aurantiaca DW4/3-1]
MNSWAPVNEPPESAEELGEVVEELRRHLLWQEETGGPVLLADATKLAAERSASLRSMLPPRGAVAKVPPTEPVQAPSSPPRAETPPPAAPPPAAVSASPPAIRAPVTATSNGMLLDVPQQAPRYPGPLPGVVEGERPTLDQIRRELGDCRRCKLCTGRKNIVFGVGNPRADLVFVGEGPGENEDIQGVPFVGAAGELLTKMIQAMGFSRDEIYICNVVKCRPPGNRNPEADEIAACEPFLRSQLLAIQPKVIVALGKFAAQTLLRDTTPITRLRGQWREYQGVKLMPTFHPAYLLRSPAEKRKAWEDLQQVMKIFGKQAGART